MTGRNLIVLRRFGVVRLQAEGWHEPYESRGSRTDLWGTGGEIPPVYPARQIWHRGQFFFRKRGLLPVIRFINESFRIQYLMSKSIKISKSSVSPEWK